MKRRDFLSLMGAGAAVAACTACLGGCQAANDVPAAPTNVNFTLNLSDTANAALTKDGGYQYNGQILVARVSATKYVAVSSICTHAGGTVYYDSGSQMFHCPNHGSNFGLDGSVINGPAGSPLATYATALTGNSLKVHS